MEITVNDVNRPPAFTEPTGENRYQREAVEGQELGFRVLAQDPDGDNRQYVLTRNDLPGQPQLEDNGDGSFTFRWTPDFDAARQQPYTPDLDVNDGRGGSDHLDLEITVRNVDRPPVIDAPTNDDVYQVDVNEGEELQIQLHAADQDGDAIRWSVPDDGGIPAGWSLDDAGDGRALFTWTPGYEDAGVYEPVFDAAANGVSDRLRIEITVHDINRAPQATGQINDFTIDEDGGLRQIADLTQVFSDPDGDALNFAFAGAPVQTGMAINAGRFLIVNPALNYNLRNGVQVTVRAYDPVRDSAQVQFRLTITPVNDAPGAFDLAAPVNNDTLVNYRATFRWTRAENVDGDTIRYYFSFTFIDAPVDTTFNYGPLDTSLAINNLDTLVSRYGMGDYLRICWWVTARDAEFATESSSRRTVVIPPLSAPEEYALPMELTLEPNYPNPFNPETRIEFSLPVRATVELWVMDSRGRRVAELTGGEYEAGRHSLLWRADDAPTGVYFFILRSGSERRIVKGMLIR